MVFISSGKVLIFDFIRVVMVNKRGFIGIIIIVLVFLVVGFFIFWNLNKSKISGEVGLNVNSSLECNSDKDCVRVQTSCCPCNAGGKEECIALKNLEKRGLKFACNELVPGLLTICKVESGGLH